MADTQAYHKFPYYQYYPADFEQGTATFTLAEVGAYQRLLNYQWTHGSIPSDVKALALILRCMPSTVKAIWKAIAGKFEQGEDGHWRNAKMERVRADADTVWQRKVNAGRASAAARTQQKANSRPTPVGQVFQQNANNSESESESERTKTTKRASASPLIVSPIAYEKLREKFSYVGARLRIPHVLHDECRTKLGGFDAESRMMTWYGELDAELERTSEPIPDVFEWLRPLFKAWASGAVKAATRERLIRSVSDGR